jgi:hypothetical protein
VYLPPRQKLARSLSDLAQGITKKPATEVIGIIAQMLLYVNTFFEIFGGVFHIPI